MVVFCFHFHWKQKTVMKICLVGFLKTINFRFQCFQLRTEITFRVKWNCGDNECNFKQIKKYKKKRSQYIINFQYFYFMKTENKKSNQTYFHSYNLLKMKTVFRKWKQKIKMQTKHTLSLRVQRPFMIMWERKIKVSNN